MGWRRPTRLRRAGRTRPLKASVGRGSRCVGSAARSTAASTATAPAPPTKADAPSAAARCAHQSGRAARTSGSLTRGRWGNSGDCRGILRDVMSVQTRLFQPPIVIKRNRPASLSDPFHDYSMADLPQLLKKLSTSPDWSDLQAVLGPYLPAGTYEESVCFLPLAFDYVYEQKEGSYDLQTSLVWFASEYADELKQDKALGACRSAMQSLLQHWISNFQIDHYNLEACQSKGWCLSYADHVKLSSEIHELTSDLIRFKAHQDIAIDFYLELAASTDCVTHAAWLLELWRGQADRYLQIGDKQITAAINDLTHLKAAVNTLLDSDLVSDAQSPTYWRDMLASFDGVM